MLRTDGRGRSQKYISWAMHHRPWGTEAKEKTKLASETSTTIMAKEHPYNLLMQNPLLKNWRVPM